MSGQAAAHGLPAPWQTPKGPQGSRVPHAMAQGICFPQASLSHLMPITEQIPCFAQEEMKQLLAQLWGGLTMPHIKTCSIYLVWGG